MLRALTAALLSVFLMGATDLPKPAPGSAAFESEYRAEVEKDFPIRSIGDLSISSRIGDIQVTGWALDKIRVLGVKRAVARSPEEADLLFSELGFHFKETDGDIEITAEHGRGLDIQKKLHERKQERAFIDLVVKAPSNLKLKIWAVDGTVRVAKWNTDVDVRNSKGDVLLRDVDADLVNVVCPDCPISLHEVEGKVRCVGGKQKIEMKDVTSPDLYIETMTGPIQLAKVRGRQLLVSESGTIEAEESIGHIEFQSEQGLVNLFDSEGFVSGKTLEGNIKIHMSRWAFQEKAFIESEGGDIQLTLPSTFSGELEAASLFNQAKLEFPLQRLKRHETYGPERSNRFTGLIGDGGEKLTVFSKTGAVKILKGI